MPAVIFDLFETLITENHPEWFGHQSPAEQLGIDKAVFEQAWRSRYQRRMTGQIDDHAAVLREICEHAGATPSRHIIDRLVQERLATKARPFERIEPDIIAMLHTVRRQGLFIGVVSNCTREEAAEWHNSPFPEIVDVAVLSHEVGVMKPEPEIYTFACSRLGVAPGNVHYVGDGGSDELRGAHAAGLRPIWATWFIEQWPWDWPGNVAETAAAFVRCRSVTDLPGMLQQQA